MISRILLVIAVGTLVSTLADCIVEPPFEETIEELQLAKLSATWKVSRVTKDGVLQTGYENFKLALTGTPGADWFAYSCTGQPNPTMWPENGTWKFGQDPANSMLRDVAPMEIHITYTVTDKQLEMTFQYVDEPPRGPGVEGQWVFLFAK